MEMRESNRNIFIVHGRDNAMKEDVATFVKEFGYDPIILHWQANKGRTIIEKFEECGSKACFAIALFSPDDKGGLAEKHPRYCYRARQNVVFECGYFMGRLGRSRVCALLKGDVEKPSDYSGILYVPYDEDGSWKAQVRKEIEAACADNCDMCGVDLMCPKIDFDIKESCAKVHGNTVQFLKVHIFNNESHTICIRELGVTTSEGECLSVDEYSAASNLPHSVPTNESTTFALELSKTRGLLDERSCVYIKLGDKRIVKSRCLTRDEIAYSKVIKPPTYVYAP